MKDNEVIEGDAAIAKFMGWEMYNHNSFKCPNMYPIENSRSLGWSAVNVDQLEFASRWDWLMPVVEKIRTTGYSNEVSFGITDGYSNNGEHRWSVYIGANLTRWEKDEKGEMIWPNTSYKMKMDTVWWHSEKNLIKIVYKAVLEFISWYNQQKKV